jgi:NADPH-dependent ferric siderophore reductase
VTNTLSSETADRTTGSADVSSDPWITFTGTVRTTRTIGHSILRVTCAGEEFGNFADTGFDQRVKLILPLEDSGYRNFPCGADWYERWRRQPENEQNPIRTYTVRDVRRELGEVDIDLVLHGINGPASAWAAAVMPGDQVAILGPNARFSGDHGGIEFRTPRPGSRLLLAGDETAQPAITRILEQLPADATGSALLEMPHPEDIIDLIKPDGIDVHWLIRGDRQVGEPMLEVFGEHARTIFSDRPGTVGSSAQGVDDLDDDVAVADADQLIWDVSLTPASESGYAWIAGEASMVRTMRRFLVSELGVNRNSVAFMGYWRI